MRVRAFIFVTACWIAFPELGVCQREVKGQTIVSHLLPAVSLTFAGSFRYAGGQTFPLYGVAEAEQHFFVDADRSGQVRRFYWMQFEHYLPDNNDHYNYAPVRVREIGGLSFIYDTRVYTDYAGLKPAADSDSARARALLASKGFKLPVTAVRARLVHLPGSDRRSELMIIYVEALAPGRVPRNARNEAAADDAFPELAKEVMQHAQKWLTMR